MSPNTTNKFSRRPKFPITDQAPCWCKILQCHMIYKVVFFQETEIPIQDWVPLSADCNLIESFWGKFVVRFMLPLFSFFFVYPLATVGVRLFVVNIALRRSNLQLMPSYTHLCFSNKIYACFFSFHIFKLMKDSFSVFQMRFRQNEGFNRTYFGKLAIFTMGFFF